MNMINTISVTAGSRPRLSGTLFAYIIPRMMKFPPLVVARGEPERPVIYAGAS
jgi:hypothetical protein